MRLASPLALLAVLVQCTFAQTPNLEPQVHIMLRPKRHLQDSGVESSADTTAILEGYEKSRHRVVQDILDKWGAKMNPVFAGTSGMDEPRLARWWMVTKNTPWEKRQIIHMFTQLRAHPDVGMVYRVPPPSLPGVINPVHVLKPRQVIIVPQPKTPNYRPQQEYFLPAAKGGFDFNFAQNQTGGAGNNVTVWDVEYDWNDKHEDLGFNFPSTLGNRTYEQNVKDSFRAHGTSVAGIVGGDNNTFGVTGIAPNATFIGISPFINADATPARTYSPPQAIMLASDRAAVGDIILIEQQYAWNVTSTIQRFIPLEWFPAEFDAIQMATKRGRVVIEAGGNGRTDNSGDGQNLDDPAFIASRLAPVIGQDPILTPNPFIPTNPSSGAVLVGAGAGRNISKFVDRSRLDFSTYGQRVDVQAWGENIVSTGLIVNGQGSYCNLNTTTITDPNLCYTQSFGGTSGASAIIAGLAASVQGILKANGKKPLTSTQFISLFRNGTTGDGQASGDILHPNTQRIGMRPDMARLVPVALALSTPA